ncbi:unnamed protein product, partial [Allacma fusca]
MPFFGQNKKDKDKLSQNGDSDHSSGRNMTPSPTKDGKTAVIEPDPTPQTNNSPATTPVPGSKPKLVFHCQQAQGSPTGLISGFSNVKELYEKIAECYGFPANDILFCTLNTHRIDMENLLSAQLCLDDFIFVHRKGNNVPSPSFYTSQFISISITSINMSCDG